MTESAKKPIFSFMNFFWLLLAGLIPIALVYFYNVRTIVGSIEPVNSVQTLTGYLKRSEGAKLAGEFVDSDGDLVADCPTDPEKQINPGTLVFSPLSGGANEGDSAADWQPFLDHLRSVTGKLVEFQMTASPPDQATELKEGKLHVCGFNTGYVPTAVNIGGFVPLVVMGRDDGSWGYKMELLVPAGSPIDSPDKIRGRTIYLTSAGSHSGFKSALVYLREQHKLLPGRDYDFKLSGGHTNSIRGIADKSMEVVAVASDILEREVDRGTIAPAAYRSIYSSSKFPPACFGHAHQIQPELAAKIREAFVTFNWTDTSLLKRYEGSKFAKFVPISYKKDWEYVREIDEKLIQW